MEVERRTVKFEVGGAVDGASAVCGIDEQPAKKIASVTAGSSLVSRGGRCILLFSGELRKNVCRWGKL